MRWLVIAHGLPPAAAGGAELHAMSVAQGLRCRGDDVVLLAREADPQLPELHLRSDVLENVPVWWLNRTYRGVQSYEELYASLEVRDRLMPLVVALAPDVVHIHHLTHLSTGLLTDLSSARLPIVLTLHDYWLICQRGQMFDVEGRSCDGPHRGCRGCAELASGVGSGVLAMAPLVRRCEVFAPQGMRRRLRGLVPLLPRRPGAVAGARERRWQRVQDVFRLPFLAQAPSNALREVFVEAGIPADRIRVVPYGISGVEGDEGDSAERSRPSSADRLRVGFLGSLIPSKGLEVLLDAGGTISQTSEGTAPLLDIRIAGALQDYHGENRWASTLGARLRSTSFATWIGPLARQDVRAFLEALDVLVVPSIWQENAPLVILEARAAGLPVVASEIGGLPELVRDEVDGFLFPPGDSRVLAGILERLAREPETLERVRSGVMPPRAIGRELEGLRGLAEEARALARAKWPRLAVVILDHETPADAVLAIRILERSERTPDFIVLVENGSNPATVERLRRRLPDIEILHLKTNLGFSGGINRGVDRALALGARRVLILNADVLVDPSALGRLEAALEKIGGAGIVGPVVLDGTRTDRVASRGLDFARWSGRMRLRGAGSRWDPERSPPLEDVDAVPGCALLIDRKTWEALGGFEESWWFSFEDLELGLRGRREGARSVIAGTARVLHLGSRSIGPANPQRLYFAVRNHLRLAGEAAPLPPPLGWLRAGWIVVLTMAHAVTGGYPRRRGLQQVLRGVRHHLRGISGSG